MADINLQVGAGSKFGTINIRDAVNGNYVAATISNVSVVNSNPEFATIIPNPSNVSSIKATPVAAGSGTATVSLHLDYTDPGDNQAKSVDKTVPLTFNVIAAPHGVNVEIIFP